MDRKKGMFLAVMTLVCVMVFMPLSAGAQKAAPKGAKAIFDSGDGAAVRMSSGGPAPAAAAAPAPEKYVGISYKLALLKPNGDFTIVPKTRTFKTGERMKILVRTNRPGYMTIMNIGPTGNTAVLFNEYVEAKQLYEIPKSTALRFAGAPGTEKIMIMLSGNPNPIGGGQPTTMAGGTGTVPPPPAAVALPPPPSGSPDAVPPACRRLLPDPWPTQAAACLRPRP